MTIDRIGFWTIRMPHSTRRFDVFVNGKKVPRARDVILWPGPDWGIGVVESYRLDEKGLVAFDWDKEESPMQKRYGFIRMIEQNGG